jgi:uncharacterized protein (TIGR04255 family)
MGSNEIYPNAPLVEAIFEIRFPGEPAVECRRDEFFELIRSQYGVVFVPKIKSGQSPALEVYHFKSEDGRTSVMTAINRFSFSTKKYEGYRWFRDEALRLIRLFSEKFKIVKLNRTGLRYLNVIPFVRGKEGTSPLRNFLNVDISLPPALSKDFRDVDLAFTSKTPGGSITTNIGPLMSNDGTQESILLDFDFAKENDLHIRNIEQYLDESHQRTKEMFEQIITEEYRKYVKGEGI